MSRAGAPECTRRKIVVDGGESHKVFISIFVFFSFVSLTFCVREEQEEEEEEEEDCTSHVINPQTHEYVRRITHFPVPLFACMLHGPYNFLRLIMLLL